MGLPGAGFQFLIGTIKTFLLELGSDGEIKFQFLIGTIKTYHLKSISLKKYMFQFLIGTIKTQTDEEGAKITARFNSL